MSEDSLDNVYSLPKFDHLTGFEYKPRSNNLSKSTQIDKDSQADFVCRICKDNQGFAEIRIVLDVVPGGIPKVVVTGYNCNSCSATFADPNKFSLSEGLASS